MDGKCKKAVSACQQGRGYNGIIPGKEGKLGRKPKSPGPGAAGKGGCCGVSQAYSSEHYRSGGDGGGGYGGSFSDSGGSGAANTGGGGGGCGQGATYSHGGAGGSGIVIIRRAKA